MAEAHIFLTVQSLVLPGLIPLFDGPLRTVFMDQALCVMESIRALARAGHVVACTIHQPRQAIVAA